MQSANYYVKISTKEYWNETYYRGNSFLLCTLGMREYEKIMEGKYNK